MKLSINTHFSNLCRYSCSYECQVDIIYNKEESFLFYNVIIAIEDLSQLYRKTTLKIS